MAIKFEQDPPSGSIPEITNPIHVHLLKTFMNADDFAAQQGFFDLIDISEPLAPTLWEYQSEDLEEAMISLSTAFKARGIKNKLRAISLEINSTLDKSLGDRMSSRIATSCYFRQNNFETVFARTTHDLNQGGGVTNQGLSIVHTKYTTPTERQSKRGINIESRKDSMLPPFNDESIAIATRNFIHTHALTENINNKNVALGASLLILTGQIIPLLEMIASGDTPPQSTPKI